MKIAFFYPSMGLGGQQTAIFEIGKQLSKMGHSVTWMYVHDDAFKLQAEKHFVLKKMFMPEFNKSRFGILRILNRFYYYNIGAILVWLYCKINKIDFIVVSNSVDSQMVGNVCRFSNIKQFRYVGGSLTQVEPFWLQNYKRLKIDKYVDGYYGWPAVFKELENVGVNSQKFIDFPSAVNTELFYPLSEALRLKIKQEMSLPLDHFVIGWVGRINKNMQVWNTLLLAAELKKMGVKNIKLLIVGGGDDFALLNSTISTLGIEEDSIVTGWVPYENVNKYLNIMDFVPLLEEDPHGGSIIREAMACGRVAISVDGPSGTQKQFMHEHSSVLVSSENFITSAAESIMNLISNKSLKDKMGANARKYAVEHMSFRNQAHVIADSFKK